MSRLGLDRLGWGLASREPQWVTFSTGARALMPSWCDEGPGFRGPEPMDLVFTEPPELGVRYSFLVEHDGETRRADVVAESADPQAIVDACNSQLGSVAFRLGGSHG